MASESYLVQLLSDSNLPTGGFIASGGLESYHAHGFLPPHDTCLLYTSDAADE